MGAPNSLLTNMNTRLTSRKWSFFYSAICGLAIASTYLVVSIFQSTNSTAAVGFLFLPIFAGIGAAVGWIVAFVFFTFKDFIARENEVSILRVSIAVGIVLCSVSVGLCWWSESKALALAKSNQTSADELKIISERKFFFRQDSIEQALAANPSTPISVLEKFVRDPRAWLLNVVGENPATTLELLTEIVNGPLSYDRVSGAANNPKLPRPLVERLAAVSAADFPSKVEYELYQTYVLAALARRSDLPKEIFDRLANWSEPKHFLVVALIASPQISCDQLNRLVNQENPVLNGMVERERYKRNCN